jgi:cytochrome c peroxidase
MKEFKGPLQDSYFWDGKKDNGAFAPVGPFFVIAEVKSQDGKIIYKNKGVLWR